MDYIKETNNYFDTILQQDYLVEMTIINPKLCNQKTIQIELEQRDEGPIPHLHVYLDKTRNPRNCAYVRLDKPEYAPHHKNGKVFSKKEKEEFLDVMKAIWGKEVTQSRTTGEIKKATGYQAAVETWIDTFGETVQFKFDEEGYPKMPDYTLL